MKTTLLSIAFTGTFLVSLSQIINDNKISFDYTQLPHFVLDPAYPTYTIDIEHAYLEANKDSIMMQEINEKLFKESVVRYQSIVDSLDAAYLRSMAKWEIDVNAGKTQANGQPLPEPSQPVYPSAPVHLTVNGPYLHSDLDEETVRNAIKIGGYKRGEDGFNIKLRVLPLQNVKITSSKKGTGATTKYTYTCHYQLPVELTVESPSQGILMQLRLLEEPLTHSVGSYKSKYEYQLYMLEQKDVFDQQLEQTARSKAIKNVHSYLNDQIGFVQKTRSAEIYSVKRFKDFDYSDVTKAYTMTVQALQKVYEEKDRSSASSELAEALEAWKTIMQESNPGDKKARINDKITAMIQCNMAEIELWLAEFSASETNLNLAINAGGKFKRHANAEKGFYADQKKRWNANY